MLEHKVHMNGHWMIPYQVGLFFLCQSEIQDGCHRST